MVTRRRGSASSPCWHTDLGAPENVVHWMWPGERCQVGGCAYRCNGFSNGLYSPTERRNRLLLTQHTGAIGTKRPTRARQPCQLNRRKLTLTQLVFRCIPQAPGIARRAFTTHRMLLRGARFSERSNKYSPSLQETSDLRFEASDDSSAWPAVGRRSARPPALHPHVRSPPPVVRGESR